MNFDAKNLHPERLSTTDQQGRRVYLYPAEVRGVFRDLRTKVQSVLILFFLGLPWIHVRGEQLFFLDLANRKFNFFGVILRAHDVPGLFFVLATVSFALLFVTAAWGRVWCGWACPQTVFIDGVFRRIETFVEGGYIERKKLDALPFTVHKLKIKFLKWAMFIVAASIITHSFLAYFVGSKTLIKMISSNPIENWSSFLFIFASTGFVVFDFAWFREQFCTIVCPYGRLQSVLVDDHSSIVGYDFNRGEPRRSRQAAQALKTGDCVDCFRCVQVCPTGIDIRRGNQLECINCTACMDACDDVMTRLKKPTGLIRYTSERELQKHMRPHLVRARTLISGLLLAISVTGLGVFIATQQPIDVALLRARGAPYEVVHSASGEVVINRFQLELTNKTAETASVAIALADNSNLSSILVAQNPVAIKKDGIIRTDIFLKTPRSVFKSGVFKVRIHVESKANNFSTEKELTLVGPLI